MRRIVAAAASLALVASAFSCSGAAKPAPEPLTAQETEQIREAWLLQNRGADSNGEILVDLIARYGGRPLVRVHLSSGTEDTVIVREDAGGYAIYNLLGTALDTVALYDDGGERERMVPWPVSFTYKPLFSITDAYLYTLMTRDEVIDAGERLASMGLAAQPGPVAAPLSDAEFYGIDSTYIQICDSLTVARF